MATTLKDVLDAQSGIYNSKGDEAEMPCLLCREGVVQNSSCANRREQCDFRLEVNGVEYNYTPASICDKCAHGPVVGVIDLSRFDIVLKGNEPAGNLCEQSHLVLERVVEGIVVERATSYPEWYPRG
jgi:hypothetical protein